MMKMSTAKIVVGKLDSIHLENGFNDFFLALLDDDVFSLYSHSRFFSYILLTYFVLCVQTHIKAAHNTIAN